MELEIMSDSFVHNLILKRKRTQRQRPCGNSFSSSDNGLPTLVCSPSSQEGMLMLSLSTEDQEVAKCLILLAQGEYHTDEDSLLQIKKCDGLGVFECKTCNRLFHSFQALGGHRASHKKAKLTTVDDKPLSKKSASRSSENTCHNLIPPIPALKLGSNRTNGKTRVHQCLICCAEFPSGQALGGHMRKHRVNLPLNSSLLTHTSNIEETKVKECLSVTLSFSSPAHEEDGIETTTSNSEFQYLDLNLPATSSSEDEVSVTQFSLTSKQLKPSPLQDSGLVFSSPALINCHY